MGFRRWGSEDEEENPAAPHPSSGGLQDAGQDIVLELEKLRWLTVHLETVGIIVEFYRAHKVAVTGHDVGELGGDQASVRTQSLTRIREKTGKYLNICYQNSKHNGGEESTNKPLPSLLRWQLQETKISL